MKDLIIKIKRKLNSYTLFAIILVVLIVTFLIYFICNVKPVKVSNKFDKTIKETNFIKNTQIENKSGRTTIYFETDVDIFKKYQYNSYISGEGEDYKIDLELYLISEDTCYKIKSYCYEQNEDTVKFMGYYYDMFINKNQKYNLSIYVKDTNTLYITDISI